MKKLITPVSKGKMPVSNETLTTIQNEIHEATNAFMGSFGDAYVISGCKVTTVINNEITIASGFVWLQDEVCRFEGYTGSYPVYVKKSNTSEFEQKTFKDGMTKNVYKETKAVASTSPVLTGQNGIIPPYITFNKEPNKTVDIIIKEKANTGSELVWNNLVFSPPAEGYAPAIDASENGMFHSPQYTKDRDGFVHLRGRFAAGSEYPNVFQLPVGFRPAKVTTHNIMTTFITASARLSITPDGYVNLYSINTSTFDRFELDGIYYKAA